MTYGTHGQTVALIFRAIHRDTKKQQTMAERDSAYLPDDEGKYNLRPRSGTRTQGGTNEGTVDDDDSSTEGETAQTAQQVKTRKFVKLPADEKQLMEMESDITNRLRGVDLDEGTTLRILKGVVTLQRRHIELKKKKGKKGRPPPARVQQTICKTFGLSVSTYVCIVCSYLLHQRIYKSGITATGKTSNRSKKDKDSQNH